MAHKLLINGGPGLRQSFKLADLPLSPTVEIVHDSNGGSHQILGETKILGCTITHPLNSSWSLIMSSYNCRSSGDFLSLFTNVSALPLQVDGICGFSTFQGNIAT